MSEFIFEFDARKWVDQVTMHALKRRGLIDLPTIAKQSFSKMVGIRGIGVKRLADVAKMLKENGYAECAWVDDFDSFMFAGSTYLRIEEETEDLSSWEGLV